MGKPRPEHVTRLCIECKRRQSRDRYEAKGDEIRARVSQYQRDNRARINMRVRQRRRLDPEWAERRRAAQRRSNMTPEQAERRRQQQREYIHRPDVRQRRLQYRRTYEAILRAANVSSLRELREIRRLQGKRNRSSPEEIHLKRAMKHHRSMVIKASLSHEELDYLRVVAPLPSDAIRPLVVRLLAQAAPHTGQMGFEYERQLRRWVRGEWWPGDDLIGVKRLAEVSSVDERVIRRVFEKDSLSMSLDTMDRLIMYTDYTLDDLMDMASEWAMLTDDPWPVGYRGVARMLKEMRESREIDVAA